jgi:RNA polymerase sigma-70 factor, ECF subfamily
MYIENGTNFQSLEDSLFLKFIRENDSESFLKLYKIVDPLLSAMAYRMVADRNAAVDITQQSWLSVLENKDNYDLERGRFFHWIMTITKNYALRWKRRSNYEARDIKSYGDDENTEKYDTEIENDLAEISKIIRKLIKKIKNKNQQDAILMYYFAGLHLSQIAEAMDTNEQNIKNWLFRGRVQIQSGLKKIYDSDSISDIIKVLKILIIIFKGI